MAIFADVCVRVFPDGAHKVTRPAESKAARTVETIRAA
jgi:hypothetical protein